MGESISEKKFYLSRKLERESSNLEKVRESLRKSNEMTSSMLSVLTTFEGRLKKLEGMILPVYEQTKKNQTRQDNIEKTLNAIDTAINYYSVEKEVGYTIKHEKPSAKLESYLESMSKVKKAIHYFKENHQVSPELVEVTELYDTGKENLEREFESLLSSCSRPVRPTVLLDVIREPEEDDILPPGPDAETQLKAATGLTPEVVRNLKDIFKWLLDNMPTGEFMAIYSRKRSGLLIESLQRLKDHQKSGSGSSFASLQSVMSTTAVSGAGSKTPRRSSGVPKPSRRLLKGLKKGESTATGSTAAAAAKGIINEEETFEFDVEGYVCVISALLQLIEFESVTVKLVVTDKFQRQTFDMLIQQALSFVVSDGEQLASLSQRAASRAQFKVVACLFPVVRHLRASKPRLETLLESCQAPTRSRLPSLVAKMNAAGAEALTLFIDSIKNDPERASNMPVDGTVHELTRNTMHLMGELREFAEVVGAMLMIGDPSYGGHDAQKNILKVADYLTKVLSALGMNLALKAESYTDEVKGAVFMLNNYNYVYQTLKSDGHFTLIHRYDPGVEKYYLEQLAKHRRKYTESFRKLIAFAAGVRNPVSSHRTMAGGEAATTVKLTEKERQAVKDKFTGFNRELEELCRAQKEYSIPDGDLREGLRKMNRDSILPQYEIFYNTYSKVPFSKTPEKYVRYTVTAVENMLNGFFDTTS